MTRSRLSALLFAALLCLPWHALAQSKKQGNPEKELLPNLTQLTGFGEGAVWSAGGKHIASMSKRYNDAFEIQLETCAIRLLTGHFVHPGFLRVRYLPNGDYFLIGARTFKDIHYTREHDQEMWVMKADLKSPLVALEHPMSEGVALSLKTNMISWANTRGQLPEVQAPGESIICTANIEYKDDTPVLEQKGNYARPRSRARYGAARFFAVMTTRSRASRLTANGRWSNPAAGAVPTCKTASSWISESCALCPTPPASCACSTGAITRDTRLRTRSSAPTANGWPSSRPAIKSPSAWATALDAQRRTHESKSRSISGRRRPCSSPWRTVFGGLSSPAGRRWPWHASGRAGKQVSAQQKTQCEGFLVF